MVVEIWRKMQLHTRAALSLEADQPCATPSIPLSDSLLARAARAGDRDPTYVRDVFLNTGRPSRVPTIARQSATPQQLAEDIVGALLGDGDDDGAARSEAALAQWTRAHPSDSLTPSRAIAHLYTGLWAFHHDDTATVERSMKTLRTLKPPTESPWWRSQSLLFEELLGAHLALARKAPDLKSRLRHVDSLLIDSRSQDRRLSRMVGNMLVADLWERAGEPQQAFAANHRRVMRTKLASVIVKETRRRRHVQSRANRAGSSPAFRA